MKKSFSLSKFIVCSKQLSGLRDRENEQKESEVVVRCVILCEIKENSQWSWACSALWRTPLQTIFMNRRTSVRLHPRDIKSERQRMAGERFSHPAKCLVYIPFQSTQFYSFKRAALCACYCSNLTEFQFPLSLALSAVFSSFNRLFCIFFFCSCSHCSWIVFLWSFYEKYRNKKLFYV